MKYWYIIKLSFFDSCKIYRLYVINFFNCNFSSVLYCIVFYLSVQYFMHVLDFIFYHVL